MGAARSSSAFVSATSGAAPLDTSDRCDASLAEHRALVEHPLHRAAGQADERLVEHRPIEPQIDGDDRRRRHRGAPRRSVRQRAPAVAIEELRQREPRHGRRSTDSAPPRARRRRRPRRPRRLRHESAPARRSAPRRRAARCNARAGSAYIRWSGLVGRRSPPRADRGPNISASTRAKGGAAASRRLVQRRERQRLPQHLAQARGLAVANQPALDRLAGRRRDRARTRPELAPARSRSGAAIRSTAADRASRARPTRTRRPRSATAPAAPDTRSRDRRPPRSIIVTLSCGCTRT